MISHLSFPVTTPFNFRSVLNSHGWVDLLPNIHAPEIPAFSRAEALPSGRVVNLQVSAQSGSAGKRVRIAVDAPVQLAPTEKSYIQTAVKRMLRMDEDLSGFYAICAARGEPWSHASTGLGRLLRSPSVFEDLVKVILTTNVQWGGTKRMAAELVNQYGAVWSGDPSIHAFPSPAAIAADDFVTFQQRVRLGYRAASIHTLACSFAAGDLADRDFEDSDVPSEELRRRLLAIRGIGPYAAASMLMLLGRYDFLPVDTVFMDFMKRRYFSGGDFNLPEALAIYSDWGRWKYLAYWFEMIAV